MKHNDYFDIEGIEIKAEDQSFYYVVSRSLLWLFQRFS